MLSLLRRRAARPQPVHWGAIVINTKERWIGFYDPLYGPEKEADLGDELPSTPQEICVVRLSVCPACEARRKQPGTV